MDTEQISVYSQTLVAVFKAAFELGFDPYAIAVQAKMDLARSVDNPREDQIVKAAGQMITESLLVAKLHTG
ncbi:hypothetical protein PSYCIT7_007245 [Pseudomonas syringae Cit 7]|uniref:Uncharacterized protein n=1 Tax=Pseudomonas syringae Cit 7 TaxID=629264 RepID=A0A8T8M1I2_PSESX|nr:hypothetical protein [Pseudomonas syringae]QUP67417.1 hypothetical protein PSYCIT7_007245 [Pseudomonas syringae Cit 7]SDS01801.1 hypothetical protein SAMN05421724_0474 [Pseudomonas syringae]